jgi:hypothetical protein
MGRGNIYIYIYLKYDLRESMAISWTVVMGPSSGTLAFLLRVRDCSFAFSLKAFPSGRSAAVPDCPMAMASACSGSGLFLPAPTDILSSDGKSWYLRDSDG